MKLSIVIITRGDRDKTIMKFIQSFLPQRAARDKAEITVVGRMAESSRQLAWDICDQNGVPFQLIEFIEHDDKGWITKKKNVGCAASQYKNLLVVHDDCWLHDQFIENLKTEIEGPSGQVTYDVLGFSIRNQDGSRPYDWCYLGPNGHINFCYELDDPHVYIDGTAILIRKEVWHQCWWNENLFVNQAEDVDYSKRLRAANFQLRAAGKCRIIALDQHLCIQPIKHAEKCSCGWDGD